MLIEYSIELRSMLVLWSVISIASLFNPTNIIFVPIKTARYGYFLWRMSKK